MDPITVLALLLGLVWVGAAPDRFTLAATRGGAGAARAAGRAAWGQLRSDLGRTAGASGGRARRHQRAGRLSRSWNRLASSRTGRVTGGAVRAVTRTDG